MTQSHPGSGQKGGDERVQSQNKQKVDMHAVNSDTPPFLMLWSELREPDSKEKNKEKIKDSEGGLTVRSLIASAEMLPVCPAS